MSNGENSLMTWKNQPQGFETVSLWPSVFLNNSINTDPWGIPLCTFLHPDQRPRTPTLCHLFNSQPFIHDNSLEAGGIRSFGKTVVVVIDGAALLQQRCRIDSAPLRRYASIDPYDWE